MKFLIKPHPEIAIKSRSARSRYTQFLEQNIRSLCRQLSLSAQVKAKWDHVDVVLGQKSYPRESDFIDMITRVPGVFQCVKIKQIDIDNIQQGVDAIAQSVDVDLSGKRFAVKVKRYGKQSFSSLELARQAGQAILSHYPNASVDLRAPDYSVEVELRNDLLKVIEQRYVGLGGMPLPSQGEVLCLVSGGYDSVVAAYQMIRRGAKVHFCYFNLGQAEGETGVRAICLDLWKRFSASHKVKFIEVDFSDVVHQILLNVDNPLMGVILKRQMVRAATMLADTMQISTLVTGECLGQVASQTLANLHVIDRATDKMILRPLIATDKEQIIAQAREIGAAQACSSIPEYCGVISNKPTVKAEEDLTRAEEKKLPDDVLKNIVRQNNVEDIRKVLDRKTPNLPLDPYDEVNVVIDIRHPNEIETQGPLTLSKTVIEVPFFKLLHQFEKLDSHLNYGLYCQQGLMSRFQAKMLNEKGYNNVVPIQI